MKGGKNHKIIEVKETYEYKGKGNIRMWREKWQESMNERVTWKYEGHGDMRIWGEGEKMYIKGEAFNSMV